MKGDIKQRDMSYSASEFGGASLRHMDMQQFNPSISSAVHYCISLCSLINLACGRASPTLLSTLLLALGIALLATFRLLAADRLAGTISHHKELLLGDSAHDVRSGLQHLRCHDVTGFMSDSARHRTVERACINVCAVL